MLYQSPFTGNRQIFLDFCRGKSGFCKHWHFEMEILYCASGKIRANVDGTDHFACAGEYILVNSSLPHDYEGLTDDTESMTLEFGSSLLGDAFHEMVKYSYPVMPKCDGAGAIIRDIYTCGGAKSTADELMLRGKLFNLASVLLGEVGVPSQNRDVSSTNFRQADGVNRALVYLSKKYNEDIPLEKAASVAGYETKTFCRVFKLIMGVSFHQYLNSYRIERACELMRGGERSMGNVGKLCGIPEAKSFSRLFRAHKGMTPTEFVKNYCVTDKNGES